jgi:nitroimidazol reductase NimA-like FMN-containing flavoprotein (pyridoxamine 5'-phosphate oxidase superfamily)
VKTDRTTVKRKADRARYDRETLHQILDEAPICTVAFVRDGAPVAIPTIHARIDDTLYLHGSTASGMLGALASGAEACVSATLLDGLVLARSVFHHSMNYRSAVVIGRAREVTDSVEKLDAMRAVTEHVLPGRWNEARIPSPKEIAATRIVAISIDEASAKVRTGPPIDDDDEAFETWAGVVPLRAVAGEPIEDTAGMTVPRSVEALRARLR